MPRRQLQRAGFVNPECLIMIMLLGLVVVSIVVGHRVALALGASRIMAYAIGFGSPIALAIILNSINAVYVLVFTRSDSYRNVFDVFTSFFTESIVITLFLFAIAVIVALFGGLFRLILD